MKPASSPSTRFLRGLEFELAYLSLLTLEMVKPLSRWEKRFDSTTEEALKRLEGIVEAMESEELPLEKLLANYQEGTELAKLCQGRLAEAELKIQQLEKAPNGDYKLKPLPLGKTE